MAETRADQLGVRLFNLPELLHFNDQGPQAQMISETPNARLVGFALRAGQEIKEHRSPSQLLVQVINGSLVFTVAGQAFSLHTGTVLQVGANIPHSLRATSDTLMLLTMTPSPARLHAERRD